MSGKYDDILHLPHHISSRHPQMSRHDRAAQFSPFAALTGYNDAIMETARSTDQEHQLSEDEKRCLDLKQQEIIPLLPSKPLVHIVYFEPDERKDGGSYISITKNVRIIDPIARTLIMTDGQEISLDRVYDIELML